MPLRPRRGVCDDLLKVRSRLDVLVDRVVPGQILGLGVLDHVAAGADDTRQRGHLRDVLEVVPVVEFFLALGRDVQPDRKHAVGLGHLKLLPRVVMRSCVS
jgi:hypothetical protein